MLELMSKIFICLLIAALLGFLIGYFIGKMMCKDEEEKVRIIEKEDDCGKKKDKVKEDSSKEEKQDSKEESENKEEAKESDSNLPAAGLLGDSSKKEKQDSKESKNKEETKESDSNLSAAGLLGDSNKEEDRTLQENAKKVGESILKEGAKLLSATTENEKKEDSSSLPATTLASLPKEEAKTTQKVYTEPKGLDAPRDGKKDDLVRIKGIGLKIEKKLNSLGIYHYDQIANWTQEEINWVNKFLHFSGRIEREDWIGQAKKLARGEMTEFAKRVDAGKVPTSKKN